MLEEENYRSNLIIDEAHCVKKGYVNVYTILYMCVFITGETALEQDMGRFEASFPV